MVNYELPDAAARASGRGADGTFLVSIQNLVIGVAKGWRKFIVAALVQHT